MLKGVTVQEARALAFAAIYTACDLSTAPKTAVLEAQAKAVKGLRASGVAPGRLRDIGMEMLDETDE